MKLCALHLFAAAPIVIAPVTFAGHAMVRDPVASWQMMKTNG
jgi:hypothetical protein